MLMLLKPTIYIVMMLGIYFLCGCIPSPITDQPYSGDGEDLLLQLSEVPSDWNYKYTPRIESYDNWNDVRVAYHPNGQESSDTLESIINSVSIFEQAQNATEFFAAVYQDRYQINIKIETSAGFPNRDLSPPPEYVYQSLIADEVKFLYVPDRDSKGEVKYYNYYYLARCGRVVYSLTGVVNDPEGVTKPAPYALEWRQFKTMLDIVEAKIQKVCQQ